MMVVADLVAKVGNNTLNLLKSDHFGIKGHRHLFGGQVDIGRDHAGDGRQRRLDAGGAGGAGHTINFEDFFSHFIGRRDSHLSRNFLRRLRCSRSFRGRRGRVVMGRS